jgi:hypothetical protein
VINEIKKYIDLGLSLIPCKLDKSPNVNSWKETEFAINDFDGCEAIGIRCGKYSGGLECIDIDNHSDNAKENLKLLIDEIKDLYEKYKFPIEKTQGGGYHLLFKCEFNEGNLKLASVPKLNKSGKWMPDAIFETRGEGGYFLAYPSKGYTVVKNDIFNIPNITPDERKQIIDVCRSFNTFTKYVPNEYEQTEKPGDIYNKSVEAIDEAKGLLRRLGWKESGRYNWIRPDKTKGISATFGRVAENVFYVFSANAYPFDLNSAYTPFQIKTLLEHNGNFKECAKELAERFGLNKQPKQESKKEVKPIKTDDEKLAILKKSLIDTDIEIEKPPVIVYISNEKGFNASMNRLFTLGNFSAIIGKAKSRKTFSLTMMTACLVKNGSVYNKFFGQLPEKKRGVLYFDTEQGLYDSANVIKRIERLAGIKHNGFVGFNIREYAPLERCEIIEYALIKFPEVGFVAIDGIADLSKAINDEEEATRVTGLLLRWTKQYNCHIATILHQNKNDNFATGHLGSSVMKKAEIVISVSKEKGSESGSTISCDFSRGMDFDDFSFFVNAFGLPELEKEPSDNIQITTYYD